MSQVIIAGDTSGTITLQAPAVSGSTTLTLPAATGTVMVSGNMPAFSAYQSSSQTLSAATLTKILFQTEEFDTNNNFASSTFTPTVAGYYQVTGSIRGGGTQIRTYIYKNGSTYKLGTDVTGAYNVMAGTLVYCNGSTDYIEFYALFVAGGATSAASAETWFNGCLVRAA
jgi:hypothetical protein